MRHVMSLLFTAVLAAALLVATTTPATAQEWEPGPALYDIVVEHDVAITMRDGRVLRANIHRPAMPGTDEPAPGEFPVIMIQTPYGKTVSDPTNPYLIRRGYIGVVVDVAGTGGSEGVSQLFGESEALDGAELVDWAADLPGSSGDVGLLGHSYSAINQLFTAAAVGPDSPLKAIFPNSPAADPYRDLFVSGGVVNTLSSAGLIASYFGMRTFTPFVERWRDPDEALRLALDHALQALPFEAATAIDVLLDGDRVFDGDYWQERAPQRVLEDIVANDIAVYLVGGQYDVFQRGTPLLYSGLQNAWSGRSIWEPMEPGQPVTPKFQMLTGGWDHGNMGVGIDFDRIQLAWFDYWLKGIDTGILDTDSPVHIVEPDGTQYRVANYPTETAENLRVHLQPRGALGRSAPAGDGGSSPLVFKGIQLACQQSLNQWSAGALRDVYEHCSRFEQVTQPQLGDASFETDPLTENLQISGPVGLTLHASANRPQTMFVATLQSVAPDGRVRDISAGSLLGSARAIDEERSWAAADDAWALPFHPHTREAEQAVPIGEVVRYDIEIRPIYETIPAGHRVRLVLQTGDTPHLTPSPLKLVNMLGGLYHVQHNDVHQSWIDLPVTEGVGSVSTAATPIRVPLVDDVEGLLDAIGVPTIELVPGLPVLEPVRQTVRVLRLFG